MNGAESLARTLVEGGVHVCFANPGTSEMHFVAALDRVKEMRCILGLFEGVVTGAADGYARMKDRPAATLLHLGPGLGNGFANLHNASKAYTPIVNIVGDHATYHRRYNSPLTSDIEALARVFSGWTRTSLDARSVSADAAAAIAAARTSPGQIATLILPADAAWTEATDWLTPVPKVAASPRVPSDAVRTAAKLLSAGKPTLILLAGGALRAEGLALAGSIASKTGAKLMAQAFNGRIERGIGRVPIEWLPYPVDSAIKVLSEFRQLILVGAAAPVAFFAYPGKPSLLARPEAEIHVLSRPEEDGRHALEWLADELNARADSLKINSSTQRGAATGTVTPEALGASLAVLLPENAIVIDESITTGRGFSRPTQGAAPHDWLQNTGGSIGIGLPLAVGAAVACPDRKVIALQADGSGMYTLQALWTQAREALDVTTLLFSNHKYVGLRNVLTSIAGPNVTAKAYDMLDIGKPDLDWVALSQGMGVPGMRVETMDEFNRAFAGAVKSQGPRLIEVAL